MWALLLIWYVSYNITITGYAEHKICVTVDSQQEHLFTAVNK